MNILVDFTEELNKYIKYIQERKALMKYIRGLHTNFLIKLNFTYETYACAH